MKNPTLKSRQLIIPLLLFCCQVSALAQDGPGGIGTTDGTSTLKLWLRADKGVFTDAGVTPAANGQAVQQWNDQSGNKLHGAQAFAKYRPVLTATSFNGFPALTFSANGTLLNATLDISPSINPNITVFAVASHTDMNGITQYSKLWGHDNAPFDRAIGYDPRAASTFTFFDGSQAADFPFRSGSPATPDKPFLSSIIYTPDTFKG